MWRVAVIVPRHNFFVSAYIGNVITTLIKR